MTIHAADILGGCHGTGMVAGSQVEPDLSVDPADRSVMAAVWQQDRFTDEGAAGTAVAVSRDGGRTWTAGALPAGAGCGNGNRSVSDPEIGIGGDGRFYASVLTVGPAGQAVAVSSSADSGRSWSQPVTVRTVADASAVIDKPALLADRYRPGTAYVVWVEYPRRAGEPLADLRADSAFLSVTHDGGATWSGPRRFYGADTEDQNHVPVELADGHLVDVFAEAYRLSLPASTESVRAVRSTDGGRSWSAAVSAAEFPFTTVTTGPHGNPVRAFGQDVSASAARNDVYVSWEYDTPTGSQIGVAHSTDEGRTWIRDRNPVDGPVIAFVPEIAADSRGRVAVTWYQTTPSAGGATTVEFAELDRSSGRWQHRSLMGPFDLGRAAPSPEGWFLGDYEGLSPTACGFRAVDAVTTGTGPRVDTAEVAAGATGRAGRRC